MRQMFFLPQSRFTIIAGNGRLPFILASAIKAAGHEVSLLLLQQDANAELYKNFATETVAYGQIDKALKFLKTHQTEYLIFAGGMQKPDLKSIKVDIKGGILLARLLKAKILGDDHLLRIVAGFFEENGPKVISPLDVLENVSISYPSLGKISKNDEKDIQVGVRAAKTIGDLDIGQAVIVENACVIGVEAIEGTDQLIERSANLRRGNSKSGILVKVMKDSQDVRLDIPCIGPDTVENLAQYNYQGLALEKNKVILIDPDEIYAIAKQHGLFIHFFVN